MQQEGASYPGRRPLAFTDANYQLVVYIFYGLYMFFSLTLILSPPPVSSTPNPGSNPVLHNMLLLPDPICWQN
jgi:hypothetical protein